MLNVIFTTTKKLQEKYDEIYHERYVRYTLHRYILQKSIILD